MQVDAHQKAVALFEAYAAGGENNDLRGWAEDTLPALKKHLEEAKDLNEKVAQTAEAKETNQEPKDRTQRSTSDHKAMGTAADDRARPSPQTKIKYITRQAPTDWTAEALIGRTVETTEGDSLGEINK